VTRCSLPALKEGVPIERPKKLAEVATTEVRLGAGGIKTFLIADVRGYTRFTERHGDEAAGRLAVEFSEIASSVIGAAGGSVIEFRGDEALAVFDSARGAIDAAIELQRRLAEATSSDPSLPLPTGIGLDAGEAVPVAEGYRGGALNRASRLCSVALAGEIRPRTRSSTWPAGSPASRTRIATRSLGETSRSPSEP
jgi:class 3 adenylate cyclase